MSKEAKRRKTDPVGRKESSPIHCQSVKDACDEFLRSRNLSAAPFNDKALPRPGGGKGGPARIGGGAGVDDEAYGLDMPD